MTEAYLVGGNAFQTARQAKEYMSRLSPKELNAIRQKTIQKLILNSTYGFTPGSAAQKMAAIYRRHRAADEREASIWRRLFGEPKPKYTPFPGGASLQYGSSATVRLYNKAMADKATRTGRKNLKKMLKRWANVQK